MTTMNPTCLLLCSVVAAGTLLHAQRARAAEVEPVHLEVVGPPACVDEAALRADIAALGGRFRDANLDDRARTFRIEVTRTNGRTTPGTTETASGRLVIQDLVFRSRVREVSATDCDELSRSLALVIATALDERDEPPPGDAPAPMTAAPRLWPAPAGDPDAATRAPPRLGSGGIAATVFASGLTSQTTSEGLRVHGVARVVGTTRFGLVGATAQETRRHIGDQADESSRGASTRAGGVVGWGAPWNDSVVGFTAELGVGWGEHRGTRTPFVPQGAPSSSVYCATSRCVGLDVENTATKRWSFVSPYVASQLVFQIPLKKLPVRPIASIGSLWVPMAAGAGSFGTTIEAGLAWQAW